MTKDVAVFLFFSKLLPLFLYPTGLICLLLLVALIFRSRRWAWWPVVLALAVLWLGGNRLISMSLVRSLEWRHLTPAVQPDVDALVVLGGGTRPGTWPRPIDETSEAGDRLIYAAYLYQQGVAPRLVLSGGGVPVDGPIVKPEAVSMAEILEIMGVPPNALWLETNSRNTYENAVETKKLLEPEGIDQIGLVTSATHMPRSVAIFDKQGFDVIPLPTDFLVTQVDWDYYFSPDPAIQIFNLIPTAENLDRTTRALKEYIGILVYRLRGWL